MESPRRAGALGVPVVSGNVSLYNETSVRPGGPAEPASQAILPTPTIAAVGLVGSADCVVTAPFKRVGDVVLLLGETQCAGARALGGSEWLVRKMGKLAGVGPPIDLAAEARLQRLLLELARMHALESAHDVSDGGLATALVECCTVGTPIGARIELPGETSQVNAVAALFGEAPSRVVISARADAAAGVLERARAAGVRALRIGETGGNVLAIALAPVGSLSVRVDELRARRDGCLRGIVGD